jgi:formate dehydrogenase maturation protein FdhE
MIGAVPAPPVRSPRSETREITELRALKARHPELAGAVDMHIELLELQRRVQSRVPLPPLDLDSALMRRHQADGRPLLQFEQIPLDLSDLRLVVRQTAEVLQRFDVLDATEFQVIHAIGRGDKLLAAAAQWYGQTSAGIAAAAAGPAWAPAEAIPEAELQIVGHALALAMRPFLSRCAEVMQRHPDLASWSHPYCALCGGEPDLACLTAAGDRRLVCSRCLLQWPFDPVACPYCGNRDRGRMTSFGTPDGHYRVDGCDVCHRYLKAFDSRRASRPLMPVLDGVAMLPLDAAAIQRGYLS